MYPSCFNWTGKQRGYFFKFYFPYVFRDECAMARPAFERVLHLVRAVRLVDPIRRFTTEQGFQEAEELFATHEEDISVSARENFTIYSFLFPGDVW